MSRILIISAGLLLCVITVSADEKPAPASDDAARKSYKALIDAFEEEGSAR